jgi:hypothetical protein
LKLVLFLLLAGVVPGWSETRGATLAPVALYTQFAQAPPEAVRHALQDEVEAIMTPLGFHFEWRDMADPLGQRVSAELALITFEGRCDTAVTAPFAKRGGPLGWTQVTDGQILPFTNVNCDLVREMVRPTLVTSHADARAVVYGRALGRVLAHELYHIFAKTTHHGSCGVAKESYTMSDLVDADFRFEVKESLLLKSTRGQGTW